MALFRSADPTDHASIRCHNKNPIIKSNPTQPNPTQAIKSPTRFREGNNPSLLDLVFTKYPDDVSSVQMLAPLGKSDHAVI